MGRDRPRSGQGGEVWVGAGRIQIVRPRPGARLRLQRRDDLIHHPRQIASHVTRPEPQDPKSVPRQHAISDEVVFGLPILAVLAPIDFDR